MKTNHDIIENMHKIQAQAGNWAANEYMRGMYNALELCMAILDDREPMLKSELDATQYTDAYQRGASDAREELEDVVRRHMHDYARVNDVLLPMLVAKNVVIKYNWRGEHARVMDFTASAMQIQNGKVALVGRNNTSGLTHVFTADQIDSWEAKS